MPLDDHRLSSYADEDIFDPPKTNGDQAVAPTDQESFNAPFELYWPAQPNLAPQPADPDGHHAWRWRQYQDHQAELRKMVISGLPYLSEARLGLILDGLYGADEASSRTAQMIAEIYERLTHKPVELAPISLDSPAFYGLAGTFAKAFIGSTESDPGAILVQFMVIMGNIMNQPRLMYRQSKSTPCQTNIVLVGESGIGRKETSLNDVNFIVEQAAPEWVKNCVWNGVSTGEGILHQARTRADDDDVGVHRDKRLMVLMREFTTALAKMNKAESILSPVIRQGFDGSGIDSLTKVDATRVADMYLSLIGHITPKELIKRMPDVELVNGFASRLPVFYCRGTLSDGLLPFMDEDMRAWLVSKVENVIEHSRRVERYDMTPAARAEWSKIYQSLQRDQPYEPVLSLIQRGPEYVLRWALTYAVLDQSPGDVDVVHLQAARALWMHCRRTYEGLWGGVMFDDDPQRLFNALKTAGPLGMTFDEIKEFFHRRTERSGPARKVLIDRGYAFEVQAESTGRGPRATYLRLTEAYVVPQWDRP